MKNKLMNFWSKHENRVLIYSIFVLIILNIYSRLTLVLTDFEPHVMGEYDPDSVVAGYIALFDAASVFASVIGIALYLLLIVFFFTGCGVVSLIFNIVSRLFRLGIYKRWKDITAKVFYFIGLAFCVIALIGMIFFGFIYIHLNIPLFIITLISFVLIVVINVVSIKSLFKINNIVNNEVN